MESTLSAKEGEFHKENEKLEKRTRELMQKVNDVMKIQDTLLQHSLETKTEDEAKKYCGSDTNGTNNNCLNDFSPAVAENMGNKATHLIYLAKIKELQKENTKLQAENRKTTGEMNKLHKENICLIEEKEKWFSFYNTSKNDIRKLESQVSILSSKLLSKDGEISGMKKELDHLKKEIKSSNLQSNNYEVRLNRIHEDNEKLKLCLKAAKEEEKDLKDSSRKQISELTATVKEIEKHKVELLNGYRKQMQLIDNLKKQMILLGTLKTIHYSEVEYLKILDLASD